MSTLAIAASCVVGCALVVGMPQGSVAGRRLQRLRGAPPSAVRGRSGDRQRVLGVLAGAMAGLAVAIVLGGWHGPLAGLVVAAVLGRVLARLEPSVVRRERIRAGAELPFAVDLVAAGLSAGAPVAGAVTAAAEVWGGPLGKRLDHVAAALWLGTPATEAWAYLADIDGAARVITTAVRSSESGAALADALRRVADDLRVERAAHVEAAARRAGVLVVLPLGLCFLPAFVLAGLVPLVIAILRQVAP